MGNADAVFQSLDIIESHAPDYVIILAVTIYNMDYGEMLVVTGRTLSLVWKWISKKQANSAS